MIKKMKVIPVRMTDTQEQLLIIKLTNKVNELTDAINKLVDQKY